MKSHDPTPAEQLIDCPDKDCGRIGVHGFDRKDHLREHLRMHHLQDISKEKGVESGK